MNFKVQMNKGLRNKVLWSYAVRNVFYMGSANIKTQDNSVYSTFQEKKMKMIISRN